MGKTYIYKPPFLFRSPKTWIHVLSMKIINFPYKFLKCFYPFKCRISTNAVTCTNSVLISSSKTHFLSRTSKIMHFHTLRKNSFTYSQAMYLYISRGGGQLQFYYTYRLICIYHISAIIQQLNDCYNYLFKAPLHDPEGKGYNMKTSEQCDLVSMNIRVKLFSQDESNLVRFR